MYVPSIISHLHVPGADQELLSLLSLAVFLFIKIVPCSAVK